MKDKLTSALGGIGFILFYALIILCAFSPLLVLDFPIWVDFFIILFISIFRMLGSILCIGLYIWAFKVALSQPINIVSIIFFICSAVYFFLFILPSTLQMFKKNDDT